MNQSNDDLQSWNTPPNDRPVMNQPNNPRMNQQGFQFSADEKRVLGECNSESFYQRSLPIATFLGLGTHYSVQLGYLQRNSRFGSVPKVAAAVCFGYFVGKVSYQGKCAEKLMQLPNSSVGQLLRQRRDGELVGPVTPRLGNALPLFGAPAADVYTDTDIDQQNSSLDLDTDRANFSNSNLDDTYRTASDSSYLTLDDSTLPPRTPGISYDTLRDKNRNEHTAARSQPYK